MVSIERCSMSVFVTKLLVETLLPLPRGTICLGHRLARMEHLSERGLTSVAAEPLERRDRGAPQGGLPDLRRDDGAREPSRLQLRPPEVAVAAAAGRDS